MNVLLFLYGWGVIVHAFVLDIYLRSTSSQETSGWVSVERGLTALLYVLGWPILAVVAARHVWKHRNDT